MDDMTRFMEESRQLPKAEQEPYWDQLAEAGRLGENRVWLGNTGDKGSALQLKDAKRQTRMMLLVAADGQAEIRMLDEHGKVSRTSLSAGDCLPPPYSVAARHVTRHSHTLERSTWPSATRRPASPRTWRAYQFKPCPMSAWMK